MTELIKLPIRAAVFGTFIVFAMILLGIIWTFGRIGDLVDWAFEGRL